MIKSMTGFGRGANTTETGTVTIEIRSVNSRFIDYSFKSPRDFIFMEDRVKKYIMQFIKRGKLDVFLSYNFGVSSEREIIVDESLASAYVNAAKETADKYDIKNDLTALRILTLPDVVKVQQKERSDEEMWEFVKPALDDAIKGLLSMREAEGKNILANFESTLDNIEGYFATVVSRAPEVATEYRDKLNQRINDLLEGKTPLDPQRLSVEVAIFADKCCIDEEIARLDSHIHEFRGYLKCDEEIGRKVDFLIQEMNREVNTMGSKANDSELVSAVIAIKGEIEKLREQIQNIE